VTAAFQSDAFQNNAFQVNGISAPIVVGGSGSEDADGEYAEPRRVYIKGKPFTVHSKAQYLGLLARQRRDKARTSADAIISKAQDAAREAVARREEPSAQRTAEIATLLQIALDKRKLSMALVLLIASNE
jgi:hypothetical protein